MEAIIHGLTSTWGNFGGIAAIISGLVMGYLIIGHFVVNPFYASGEANAAEYAKTMLIAMTASGCLFWGPQLLQENWEVIASRFALWLIYSVTSSFGLAIRLQWHLYEKHIEAKRKAILEVRTARKVRSGQLEDRRSNGGNGSGTASEH